MIFHAAISDRESTDEAVAEVLDQLAGSPDAGRDVAFVFFTAHHATEAEAIVRALSETAAVEVVVGCSGEGVIARDREIERAPGLAVLVGALPGVRVHPFHIRPEEFRAMVEEPDQLLERLGYGLETRALVGFGDPFSTPVNALLPALTTHCPRAPLVGGMASAGRRAGGNLLVVNDATVSDGFVGVSLSGGGVAVETVVSQGCRPVGETYVITRGKGNMVEQLGGRPAARVLGELVHDLPEEEQALLANGLYLGRAISEYRDRFTPADFLVRNIIGIQEKEGALAIGDHVRTGQTVQFFVRDARTASDDLAAMLQGQRQATVPPAAGGLLFSCNGRGTRLFDRPCHDISAAREAMPDTPLAGFFAAGEFGPVGGQNFIHGHTASIVLFRRP